MKQPKSLGALAPIATVALTTASTAAMLALTPVLRAYARRRLRSSAAADDAVQGTIERAWKARSTFIEGTNFEAWMFGILRNLIIDEVRRNRRVFEDVAGPDAAGLSVHPEQHWRADYKDLRDALDQLPPDMSKALLLIGIGLTDVEAAATMGLPLGTVKSHIRRGRVRLRAAGV